MDAAALAAHRRLWQEPLQDIADTYPLSILNAPDDLMSSCVLWTYSEFTREPDLQLQSLVEGLTLLAFLAQTDAAAWLRELKLVWPEARDADWIDDHVNPVVLCADAKPWVVGLNLLVRDEGDLDLVEDYITEQEETTRQESETFQSVCSGLEASMVRPMVPVCLELDFDEEDSKEQRRVLRRIIEIAEIQVYETESAEQTDGAIKRSGRLHVSEVRLMRSIDGTEITSKLVDSLQSLLQTKPSTSRGVRSVVVSDNVPSQFIPALLSGLQGSQCVNAVHLTTYGEVTDDVDDDESRESMWSAVASALCSPESNHSIQKLELALDHFEEEDFEAFQAMYLSQTTQSERVDSAGGANLPSSSQRLTASRFSLVKPSINNDGDDEDAITVRRNDDEEGEDSEEDSDGDEDDSDGEKDQDDEDSDGDDGESDSSETFDGVFDSSSVFESRVPLDVRHVDNDDEIDEKWRTVVLPGAGRAWVHPDDVQARAVESTATSARGFRQISVTTMTERSMDSVANLISLIGNETHQLSVGMLYGSRGETPIDQWCIQVMSSCPKLESIEFGSVGFRDLRLLVDCVVREGHCLRSLSLGYVHAKSLDHVRDFFRVLCDGRHPFTAQLKELSLVLVLDNEEELVEPLIEMLDQNRTLHTISIGFRQDYHTPVPQRVQQITHDRLDRYRDQNVAVRADPLDLQSKLALISTIHSQSAPDSSCRAEIDTSIMSIIFQLAAPSRTRRVRLLRKAT